MQLKAHAPGSLMLMGEHAVLHGHLALVAAIDKWMCVTLKPRSDDAIIINSHLGKFQSHKNCLTIQKPFEFILTALMKLQDKFKTGFQLDVVSQFSDKVGFGSSAAVTVATFMVINQWLNLDVSRQTIYRQAIEVIREVQGIGSGADVAASVYGGIIKYCNDNAGSTIEKFDTTIPLTVCYSGFKTKTVDVVQQVNDKFHQQEKLLKNFYLKMDEHTNFAIAALTERDWQKLGETLNQQQVIMDSLGVSLPILDEILIALKKDPGIFGAKISGSGLGDCLIGLGQLKKTLNCTGGELIPVNITLQGTWCEKD